MVWLSRTHIGRFLYKVAMVLVNVVFQNTEAEETTLPESNEEEVSNNLVKGLAIGFGSICGVIVLFCILWTICCGNCCSSKPKKPLDNRRILRKIAPTPSPPRSGTSTRSTVRSFQST